MPAFGIRGMRGLFQLFQAQQAAVAQAQQYLALAGVVKSAVDRAAGDLMSPNCAGLFGPGPFGVNGDLTNTPADELDRLEASGGIRLAGFDPNDNGPPAGVGAVTQNDGTIYIAANRYFFTGIDQNGASVLTNPNSVFNGLTMSQMQETILIHELLHSTGIVGADNAGQMIQLGNGQVVQGSAGVTAAVEANCLH